ncbi:MAG: hypothetical protein ACEQSB_00765 [Undibacterium sp.]
MSDQPYNHLDPEIQAHWAKTRAAILAKTHVDGHVYFEPMSDLKSARRQLAICEREADEWRDVIKKMEGKP